VRWSAAEAYAWIIQQKPLDLREWTSDMGPKIADAQKTLAALIADGKIKAWGRKQPHDSLERIPGDLFRISDVTVVVGIHGDMTVQIPHTKCTGEKIWHSHKPYTGHRWHSIEFEADEIKRECPKPPPPSAQDWMSNNANRGEKRDYMVQTCRRETGCTKRAAEAAYRNLPDTVRRKRGRPPASSES
jgi:hypothetical protein